MSAKKKTSKVSVKEIGIRHVHCNGGGGVFYFLGFLGALFYYLSTAESFWDGIVGFFKALLWPGFLVFELFKFLGA